MDLAIQGSSWEAMSSACAKARVDDCELNGHDRPVDSTKKGPEKADDTTTSDEVMLIRYLTTDGPWSTYELRER